MTTERKAGHLIACGVWACNSIWNLVWAVVNTFYQNHGASLGNMLLCFAFSAIALANLHWYINPNQKP